MMIPDLTIPGLIRVNITSPNPQGIKGNGSIAMFTFNLAGQGPGLITSFAASLISTAGAVIPLPQPQILVDDKGRFLGNPFSSDLNQSQNPPEAITGTLGGGRSASPPEQPQTPSAASSGVGEKGETHQGQNLPPEVVEIPVASPDPASPAVPLLDAKPLVTDVRTSGSPRSILSLFKGYTGAKTVQALTALFSQPSYPGFRQEPPIVLSDGRARVTVYLTPPTSALQSPNFAFNGAKLVSLKLKGAEYVLELIPDARVFEVLVTVLSQGRIAEYPLVVAPPLSSGDIPGVTVDESSFGLFLKKYAVGKGDSNNDGRSDYLDLYLYTANYLVRKKATAPAGPNVAPGGTE